MKIESRAKSNTQNSFLLKSFGFHHIRDIMINMLL